MNEIPEWVKPKKLLFQILEIVCMALFMLLAFHIYETKSLALYKRISRDKYLNLTDGDSFTKTVELFSEEGLNGRYQILETMTFNTVSLIENISYVICITKKVWL